MRKAISDNEIVKGSTISSSVRAPSVKKGALPIYALTPFTMLDFPDKCACVVWFSGCNMRCPYCHNPELVKGKGTQSAESVMGFLQKRQGLLDGVVLSGGEASVYPGISDFVKDVKKMGFAIKLDTNGLRPDKIESFLAEGFLDYVALDHKSPPAKFESVTGTDKFAAFVDTLDMLCKQKNVPFEVRTTVHTGLMDEEDINEIIRDLEQRNYRSTYYIQNYRADNDRPTLGCLPQQTRILDQTLIRAPKGFELEFRNF